MVNSESIVSPEKMKKMDAYTRRYEKINVAPKRSRYDASNSVFVQGKKESVPNIKRKRKRTKKCKHVKQVEKTYYQKIIEQVGNYINVSFDKKTEEVD